MHSDGVSNMTRIVFDPWIPWALWLPLAVLAVGLWCGYLASSRRRLVGSQRPLVLSLMAMALAVPLGILLNPAWVQELPPPAGKPLLTLLVDRSASMATIDGPNAVARLEVARRSARAIEKDLRERFDVEIKTFSEISSLSSVEVLRDIAASGDVSDLALAVTSSLADRPRGQAIWILSDGVHNAAGGSSL